MDDPTAREVADRQAAYEAGARGGCPTCSGPTRETVGMVCQTCGTDYRSKPTLQPDAFRDSKGDVWFNLRKHPACHPGVYDATPSATPLWLTPMTTPTQPPLDPGQVARLEEALHWSGCRHLPGAVEECRGRRHQIAPTVAALVAEAVEAAPPKAGVMHDVDVSFYRLAVKERDYERVKCDRLTADLAALRQRIETLADELDAEHAGFSIRTRLRALLHDGEAGS